MAQELGGKSANIVLPDADMETAVAGGVMQVMNNSGQSCNAPTRMFVPADRKDECYAIAAKAAESVDRVLTTRATVCHIVGFGDSSVDYILRFWITDPTGGLTNIRGNVFLALWDAFQENGISIPFPQREVKLLKRDQADS